VHEAGDGKLQGTTDSGQNDGIWISPIAPGAADCGAAPKRLIPGGSRPDWGPVNLP
jgi:hypothetical protein